MVIVFILGYLGIVMEHKIKINKAAIALLTAGVLWVIYIVFNPLSASIVNADAFREFLHNNPALNSAPLAEQCKRFISEFQIIENLGEISSTLFFLIGAMTIVELVDVHDGFSLITERITTRNKKTLLCIITLISFFMSSVLDNLTTSIVMVMLVRKLIPNYKERWVFASMIIISANSGGAWSPIGDVTTIMLWIKGKITTLPLVTSLILPSIVSTVVPLLLAVRILKGEIKHPPKQDKSVIKNVIVADREKIVIFLMGVIGLILIPIFKYTTGLPPFMGVLTVLGIIWIYTEILYSRINVSEDIKHRVTRVLRRIDTSTILFFLGILLSVMALQATGVLNIVGDYLNEKVHNVYIINVVIGVLSAVVDNVPLVAVAMGMYPLVDPVALSTMADAQFMQHFVQDGDFWQFLAYCSGVGGSILIIGSAAGVVVMGLEKISFYWYLKNISLLALAGYLAGAAVYILFNVL
ncbi:MAG: sodium:proton antiporter [Bacteroidetes bacterium GWF2_40_14]|nr:MAG: sodium:proton antiporter [Bacteroidetes bacterium GWF2_40_14]